MLVTKFEFVSPENTVFAIIDGYPTGKELFKGIYNQGYNASNYFKRHLTVTEMYPRDLLCQCYGVVDSPKQFQTKFSESLESDSRQLLVSVAHIPKDSSNKGKGGGWRWHKWGQYLGDGHPRQEYLDDEDKFENGVWVFNVYDLTQYLKEFPIEQ